MRRADLHVHTTASDGLFDLRQICAKAVRVGLSGLAITDHDSIDSLDDIPAVEQEFGLKIMPGVEFSTFWQGQDVHILGYGIDHRAQRVRQLFLRLQKDRLERLDAIVRRVQQLGYGITEDQVRNCAKGNSVGRAHVAQALVAAGYFPDVTSSFRCLLERGKPGYVPRDKMDPFMAVAATIDAGGVPVLAHPGLLTTTAELMPALVQAGLGGIEVYYPLHSKRTIRRLLEYTRERSLLATGGSDFHGFPSDELGRASVDMEVMRLIAARSEGVPNFVKND